MSDARAPQTTRESRSRPSSSVPSQKAADGGLRTARKLVFVGSARPRWGAAIAASAKARTRAPPRTALRLRRNLVRTRERWGASASASSIGRIAATASGSSAQARVDQHVETVSEQVEDDEAEGGAQHHPLDHGVVAGEDRVDDELAETADGEDLLGQHGPRPELAEEERGEGHDRGQRVAQRVLQDPADAGQAVDPGG